MPAFDLQHPRIRKFFELCLRMQDLPRHLGQHSGGMVICQGQLDSRRAARAGDHARPRRRAVGQGRLRRHGHRESRSAGPGHDGGAGGFAENDSRRLRRGSRSGAPARKTIRRSMERLQKADTVGMFQVESRAQMACLPRMQPEMFLRHRRAGGDHPARPDRRQDGASLSEAPRRGASRSIACIRRSSRCWRARWACRCFRSSCCAWR